MPTSHPSSATGELITMGEINPYEPPRSVIGRLHAGDVATRPPYFAWCILFGFNLIVPAFFGWGMTIAHGRPGMLVAIGLLLVAGLDACSSGRKVADPLILGAALVATSQVFPVLQVIAGMVGFAASECLGQAVMNDSKPHGVITSNLGGFMTASVTGGILMGVSYGLGVAIRSFRAK